MFMLSNAMMFLTWGIGRINVDYHIGQVTHVMQELVASLFRSLMSLLHRELRVHGNIDFCMKPMAQPSDPHFSDVTNPWEVSDRMLYFINHLWTDPVEKARKNGPARFPDNWEDSGSNEQTDNRVC